MELVQRYEHTSFSETDELESRQFEIIGVRKIEKNCLELIFATFALKCSKVSPISHFLEGFALRAFLGMLL